MDTARLLNLGAKTGPAARLLSRLHARGYRRLGGRGLNRWAGGMPVLVLETVGRRSGRPRATPVIYWEDGDDLVVVAANAGAERTPAWFLNLMAAGKAVAVIRGERRPVTAHLASGEERARLWPRLASRYGGLDRYADFTEREFPVVVLRRMGGAGFEPA